MRILKLFLIMFNFAAIGVNYHANASNQIQLIPQIITIPETGYKITWPLITTPDHGVTSKLNQTIAQQVGKFRNDNNLVNVGYKSYINYKSKIISILWELDPNVGNQNYEIYNFSITTGETLKAEEILTPLIRNFLPEIVKLSENNLPVNLTYEQFISKITNRDIQIYYDGSYRILFKSLKSSSKTYIIALLPNYMTRH